MLLRLLVALIAASQLGLGAAFLFAPSFMYALMGIAVPTQGVNYILGMLAARLLAYGVVLIVIRQDLFRHRLWLDAMIGIQVIDLLAGIYHVGIGAVPPSAAAFPMINATLFALGLIILRPRSTLREAHA